MYIGKYLIAGAVVKKIIKDEELRNYGSRTLLVKLYDATTFEEHSIIVKDYLEGKFDEDNT